MTNVGYIRHTSFLAILTDAKYIKTANVQMAKNNFILTGNVNICYYYYESEVIHLAVNEFLTSV